MMPFLTIGQYTVPTSTVLFVAFMIAATFWFLRSCNARDAAPSDSSLLLPLGFALCLCGASLLGAKVFHLAFENPRTPQFFSLRGLSINGSFIAIGLFLALGLRHCYPDLQTRKRILDHLAISFALGYGILKLGCLGVGCCWGHVFTGPWAIVFWNSPVMPLIGVPVHPVQIYDSLVGFIAFAILLGLRSRNLFSGRLLWIFCLLYGSGRFATEFFRADVARGVDVLLGASTGQIAAMSLLLVGCVGLYLRRARSAWPKGGHTFSRLASLAPLFLLLSGCRFPEPPHPLVLQRITGPHTSEHVEYWRSKVAPRGQNRLAIVVMADEKTSDFVASRFETKQVGKERTLDLEELFWFGIAPDLAKRYSRIVLVRTGGARFAVMGDLFKEAESLSSTYDAFFFTHGSPGYLSRGTNYFLSNRELKAWQGALKKLGLVYMHACFSHSLSQSWLEAGAKHVVSQLGLSVNHFFAPVFIRYLAHFNISESVEWTSRSLRFYISTSELYKNLLAIMGVNVEDYFQIVEMPVLESYERRSK